MPAGNAYLASMITRQTRARRDLKRWLALIVAIACGMVAAALWYTSMFLPLTFVVVTATAAGVFGSVVLGCGLFALAFYSDKSGHDARTTDAALGSRAKGAER